MEIVFQPADENRLGEFLNRNLSSPWTKFRAAIAFVKQSGVQYIEDNLAAFAEDHDVEMLVGIDHRGTSYEGLQGLLAAVSPTGRILVFHNPGRPTFHPKLFLFRSDIAAELIIGSGNLTAGGLYNNYEIGAACKLDLTVPSDAAELQLIEGVLDRWADESSGTTTLLNNNLLGHLLSAGLTPVETFSADRGHDEIDGNSDDDWFPFVPRLEPRAPHVDVRSTGGDADVTVGVVDFLEVEPGVVEDVVLPPAIPVGFVMTLRQTDVGTGQTTEGAQQRSPEIFIPLVARDAHPSFWQWPEGFVSDPEREGKRDRLNVRMRLSGELIRATLSYFHHRRDFRLRSTVLRNAGNVGDILRVERALSPDADYEYYVEVVPQGTTSFDLYLEQCRMEVGHGSQKMYGYY